MKLNEAGNNTDGPTEKEVFYETPQTDSIVFQPPRPTISLPQSIKNTTVKSDVAETFKLASAACSTSKPSSDVLSNANQFVDNVPANRNLQILSKAQLPVIHLPLTTKTLKPSDVTKSFELISTNSKHSIAKPLKFKKLTDKSEVAEPKSSSIDTSNENQSAADVSPFVHHNEITLSTVFQKLVVIEKMMETQTKYQIAQKRVADDLAANLTQLRQEINFSTADTRKPKSLKFPFNNQSELDRVETNFLRTMFNGYICRKLFDLFRHFTEQILLTDDDLISYDDLISTTTINIHGADSNKYHSAALPFVGPIDADHPALETCINLPSRMQFETFDEVNSLDFRQANIVALKRTFDQMDWEPIRMATNVDEAVEYFTSVVNMAIVENVPLRRPPPKPAWANVLLRKLKRCRSAALRKYSQNFNPFSKQLFTRASNEYRLYNRYLYRRYTKRIQNNLRLNPNQF
ncbi:uncharacterized protein LOC134206762 [Armigeres subalbatus]|uniref:uncharacterized protein LOC134206762 n=1 Tax=Armigeres subalbatus TaxID=124917 RepID=UPI002ED12223